MVNRFCKYPLWDCSADLIAVATGKQPADTVIKNAKLVNVCTGEILDDTSVAIKKGRIALVGDALFTIGKDTKVVDAQGMYLAPAFMDGHMHIESSMLSAGEYAKAVLPHGTSGVFFDPHEICNVLGLKGVRYMLEDAKRTPLKAMLTTPSCVPAVTGFEDTGSKIDPEDIAETMKWDECVGLGEMMNFPGVLFADPHTLGIVNETLKTGKCVTGHYSMPETGAGLNGYIASGVRCCHESVREIDSLTKMRLGMYAMLHEGSAWHDLKEVVKAVTKHKIDSRFACLVSDDNHPHTLKSIGHLDHIVKRAMEEGVDFVTAIQMVTINVATCYHLDHELGSVAPSKCADLVLISDKDSCKVEKTFIDGELVAENGKLLVEFTPYEYPKDALNTVNLDKVTESDFDIPCDVKAPEVKVRAMGVSGGKTITSEEIVSLPVKDGKIMTDPFGDVMKVVVFERHKRTGNKGYGFVKGFGIKNGALAQTVAHDAHNLLVVGTNDGDMKLAANTLIENGGGLVAVKDGKILGFVPLAIAGLMSTEDLDTTNERVEKLEKAWKDLGSNLPSPFMTMSGLSLACIPNLRLTDKGLVDCVNFKFVDLIVKD